MDRNQLFREICKLLGRRVAVKMYDTGALTIDHSQQGLTIVEIQNAKGGAEKIMPRMPADQFDQFLLVTRNILQRTLGVK